jgi:hypothetical protein
MLLVVAHPSWGTATADFAGLALWLHVIAACCAYALAIETRESARSLSLSALGCALLLAWSWGHAFIHHAFGTGPWQTAEPLLHAIWPLVLARAIWALRRRAPFGEMNQITSALTWGGLAATALGLLVVFSPWWGLRPISLAAPPAALAALAAYGVATALSFGVSDMRPAPMGYWLERAGLALSAALVLAIASLVVRRLYHFELASGEILQSEAWAYAAVWTGFGAGALWIGMRRNSALLRLSGLAALALAIAYFFFLTFTRLSGLAQAGALLSSVGLLAICGWFASIYRPVFRTRRPILGG